MKHIIKRYTFSLLTIGLLLYLSFFRPPSINSEIEIPHLDKIVHFGMYFFLSSVIWLDFYRSHREKISFRKGWVIACLFPIFFSGSVELGQEYLTTYRGGEWLDLLANSLGAITASALITFSLKHLTKKKPL